MIHHFSLRNNKVTIIVNIVFLAILSLFLYIIGSMAFNVIQSSIKFSIPLEVRDYVGFRVTDSILHGINPYSLENISNMSVPLLYLYTPLNPLLVAFLCKITGCSILLGNYILNFAFLFGTTSMLFLILKRYASKMKLVLYIILLLSTCTFFSMFGDLLFTFRADSIGIFIYSVILYLVSRDRKSTWLIALLSVLLLLTKQNMVVLALPVFLSFLFSYTDRKKSLKRAFLYVFQCTVFLILLVIFVQQFFPLLWTECMYVQFLSTDTKSFFEAVMNILVCIKRNFFFALIDGIVFIICSVQIIRKRKSLSKYAHGKSTKYSLYLMLNIITSILSLLYFAQNGADGFKYCQEMLAIPIVLLGIQLILQGVPGIRSSSIGPFYSNLAMALCILITITMQMQFDVVKYSRDELSQYSELYSFIDTYSSQDIFVDKEGTGYFLKHEQEVADAAYYDDGHITYFMNLPKTSGITAKLFYVNEIHELAAYYQATIKNKIKSGDFSALVVSDFVSKEFLQQNYSLVKSLALKNVCNGTRIVSLWVRKDLLM